MADVVNLNLTMPKHWLASILILWPWMALARPTIPQAAPPPEPARTVTRYTLISSLGSPDHDPTAWRLLGANDGGHTWTVVDVRTNQTFSSRSQRLTFGVRHAAPYNIYRLQIDARNSETISVDMSVQLAELYLSGPL